MLTPVLFLNNKSIRLFPKVNLNNYAMYVQLVQFKTIIFDLFLQACYFFELASQISASITLRFYKHGYHHIQLILIKQ